MVNLYIKLYKKNERKGVKNDESYNPWYCKRERERERELHFSEIKYSFIKHRLEEDSSKSLF